MTDKHSASDADGLTARRPRDLTGHDWKVVLQRAWAKIDADALTLVAAGVGFFAFLSVFPAITALLSIYGLVADPSAVGQHVQQLSGTLPPAAMQIVQQQMSGVTQGSGTALGLSLAVSLFLALYSASRGTTAMMTALNIVYNETESRGFIKRTALTLMLTLGGVLVLILLLALIGVGSALKIAELPVWADWLIRIVRWIVMLGVMMVSLGAIYSIAPSRRRARPKWITPGAMIATVGWLAVSIGFSYYIQNFGNYNETYGSAAAIAILLVWLWLSALLALVGAELNAAMERQTHIDTTIGRERPEGERGADAADNVGDDV